MIRHNKELWWEGLYMYAIKNLWDNEYTNFYEIKVIHRSTNKTEIVEIEL